MVEKADKRSCIKLEIGKGYEFCFLTGSSAERNIQSEKLFGFVRKNLVYKITISFLFIAHKEISKVDWTDLAFKSKIS